MSKNGLVLLWVLLSAMSLIKFAEPLRAAESKPTDAPVTNVKGESANEATKVAETENEDEAPPPPRSLHELYRHCLSLTEKKGLQQAERNKIRFECRRKALCSAGTNCITEIERYGYVVELNSMLNQKLRGSIKEQAKYLAFAPDVYFEQAVTRPDSNGVYFLRTLPKPVDPKISKSDPIYFRTNGSTERIPFEFKFRGKTYEADSLAIVGPLFDFEVRDGYLELPNFAMHDWFAKNFKPDEFRVILWGTYYPRLAISEIWPYRDVSKHEWEEGESVDAEEILYGIEDFYLGRPWIEVINKKSSDGWWALGKFTPEELPAVEAYFIKLKKEKKFCQVTLKPGTVIRADGAFQTKDPEHIKILKLPKKGLPPLVWCPEDKKGCKCKWEQPPAESYGIPTGEIHHAHGEPITIPKTANVRNWPN